MEQASGEALGSEGFTQVKSRGRGRGNEGKNKCKDGAGKMGGISKPFDILREVSEVQPQEDEMVGKG